jgi:hypothetical protein
MKKLIFVIILPILLVGCAPAMLRNPETGATAECKLEGIQPLINKLQCISSLKNQGWIETTSEEINQANTSQTSLVAKAKNCWDKIKTQPQLTIISSKVAFGHDEPTFLMFANTSKPTEEEKSAINIYADLRTNCIKEENKVEAIYPLAVRQLYLSSRSAIENQLVALYKGNLTYGQFAQSRKEINVIIMTGLAEIDKELKTKATDAYIRAEQMAVQRSNAFANITNANANQTAANALQQQANQQMFKPTQNSVTSPNLHCFSQSLGGGMGTINCN